MSEKLMGLAGGLSQAGSNRERLRALDTVLAELMEQIAAGDRVLSEDEQYVLLIACASAVRHLIAEELRHIPGLTF